MGKQFNVNQYWLKRGQRYIKEERLASTYYRLQERFLLNVLAGSKMPMDKILEIGCGYGRISKLFAQSFPSAQIMAIDLSPDQLQNAKALCADHANITFEEYDIYSSLPPPGNGYDIAIAIEIFLHHPLDAVRKVVERFSAMATYIVSLDWSEEWPWATAPHVWVHDYPALYQDMGLK